jgi:hypothetical protein
LDETRGHVRRASARNLTLHCIRDVQTFEDGSEVIAGRNIVEGESVSTQERLLQCDRRGDVGHSGIGADEQAETGAPNNGVFSGCQLSSLYQLIDEVRLNDNNVGCFSIKQPLMDDRRKPKLKRDGVAAFAAEYPRFASELVQASHRLGP